MREKDFNMGYARDIKFEILAMIKYSQSGDPYKINYIRFSQILRLKEMIREYLPEEAEKIFPATCVPEFKSTCIRDVKQKEFPEELRLIICLFREKETLLTERLNQRRLAIGKKGRIIESLPGLCGEVSAAISRFINEHFSNMGIWAVTKYGFYSEDPEDAWLNGQIATCHFWTEVMFQNHRIVLDLTYGWNGFGNFQEDALGRDSIIFHPVRNNDQLARDLGLVEFADHKDALRMDRGSFEHRNEVNLEMYELLSSTLLSP